MACILYVLTLKDASAGLRSVPTLHFTHKHTHIQNEKKQKNSNRNTQHEKFSQNKHKLTHTHEKIERICIFIYRFYALVFALIHFRSIALRFTLMAPNRFTGETTTSSSSTPTPPPPPPTTTITITTSTQTHIDMPTLAIQLIHPNKLRVRAFSFDQYADF